MKAYITGFDRENRQKIVKKSVLKPLPEKHREMRLMMVFPDREYQTIQGFGGAFTDAAGYVYSRMDAQSRKDMIRTYFGRGGMGYTWGRISLDSSDFGTEMYAADDDPTDLALERMNFSRGDRYVLPLLRDAEKALKAPVKLMITPWTPPAWMKTNQSRIKGGKLKPECAPVWAEYICKSIQHALDEGMEINLLSMQNEPHAVQRWDSCIVTDEEERAFLREHLYPALKRNGLAEKIQLVIWDHNKEHVLERARNVIVDAEMAEIVAGVAFHWYSGDHFENVRMAHELYPGKRFVFSEGCVEHSVYGSDAEHTGAIHYAHEYIGDLNAGTDTFLDWNLVLDAQGGPNHKKNFCDAPMMYDLETGTLHKKLSLDFLGHFSRHIQPGAVRLGTSSFTREIEMTAARNPDGTIAAVMLNHSAEEQKVVLRLPENSWAVTLPAGGIATCVE